MDRSEVIVLRKVTFEKDSYGVQRKAVTETPAYCQVRSATRSEFFEGGRSGLNPEYVFTVFDGDYNDETEVEYKGRVYSVYRTYLGRNDTRELYAERKGGTNGTENAN